MTPPKVSFKTYGRLANCMDCGREYYPRALVQGRCPRCHEKSAPSFYEGATVSGETRVDCSTTCRKRAKSGRRGV